MEDRIIVPGGSGLVLPEHLAELAKAKENAVAQPVAPPRPSRREFRKHIQGSWKVFSGAKGGIPKVVTMSDDAAYISDGNGALRRADIDPMRRMSVKERKRERRRLRR